MAGDFRKWDAGKDPQRRPGGGEPTLLCGYSWQTALADQHMEDAGSVSIRPLAEPGFPENGSVDSGLAFPVLAAA